MECRHIPEGITPAMLTGAHPSVQRNPIIADVFHRAGLIENEGSGTNRMVTMCKEAGIAAPTFEEITGAAVVTFRVNVGSTADGNAEPVRSRVRKSPSGGRRSRNGSRSGCSVRTAVGETVRFVATDRFIHRNAASSSERPATRKARS